LRLPRKGVLLLKSVNIEEKLTESAITAVEHAIGMIRSHQPDFDVKLMLRGYKCSQADDA
jgi:hypothetical protein